MTNRDQGQAFMTGNSIANSHFRFFNEIGIINQLATNRVERVLPHDLTMSQFTLLNHFARGLPPKSPLELANAFQVTKGAMTNTIKQLERKGFVNVEPHHRDGRSKLISATRSGLDAHKNASEKISEAMSDFVSAFKSGEIDAGVPLLEKVRIWLDENRT